MKLLVTHQFEHEGEDYPAGAIVVVSDALGAAILREHGERVRVASVAAPEPQPKVTVTPAPQPKAPQHKR